MRGTFRPGRAAAWGLAGALAAGGCVQFEHGDAGTGGAGESEGGGETSSGVPTSGADAASTGTDGTGEGGGIGGECDLWVQDCPEGSKCMPVDSDADGIQDSTKCVPLSAMPGQAGDSCEVEGSPASGVDDCGEGLICWGVDASNQGQCVQMCGGSAAQPTCQGGLVCDVSNGGVLPLCLHPCDPLTPSCKVGKVCIPTVEGVFVCDTDASGDGGGYGDDCEYINVCDEGLLCVPAAAVPGCPTPGCCTEYCDLGEPENLCSGAPMQQCVPFYDMSEPPPGYEDVGVCAIPN